MKDSTGAWVEIEVESAALAEAHVKETAGDRAEVGRARRMPIPGD
jgi:hypothetical protein